MLAVLCGESVTTAKEIYRSSAVSCLSDSSVSSMTVKVIRKDLSLVRAEGIAQVTLILANGTKRHFQVKGEATQTNTKMQLATMVGKYTAHGVRCVVRHQNIVAILCATDVRGGTCSAQLRFWGKDFFYTLQFSVTPVNHAGP